MIQASTMTKGLKKPITPSLKKSPSLAFFVISIRNATDQQWACSKECLAFCQTTNFQKWLIFKNCNVFLFVNNICKEVCRDRTYNTSPNPQNYEKYQVTLFRYLVLPPPPPSPTPSPPPRNVPVSGLRTYSRQSHSHNEEFNLCQSWGREGTQWRTKEGNKADDLVRTKTDAQYCKGKGVSCAEGIIY